MINNGPSGLKEAQNIEKSYKWSAKKPKWSHNSISITLSLVYSNTFLFSTHFLNYVKAVFQPTFKLMLCFIIHPPLSFCLHFILQVTESLHPVHRCATFLADRPVNFILVSPPAFLISTCLQIPITQLDQ